MQCLSRSIGILGLVCLLGAVTACGGTKGRPTAAKEGKDASYYYLMAEMEGRRNELSKAIGNLDRALKLEPAQPRFWYKRAFFHAASGNLKKGEEDVAKALELAPDDEDSLLLQGKIFQSSGRTKEAMVVYRKAVRQNRSLEDANVLLVEALIGEKDYRGAIRALVAWEKNDPDNVTPIFYEAWIYQNFLKSPSRAIAAYERALTIQPDNLKALQTLAEIYVGQKNEAKVLDVFRRMEVAQPNDVTLKLKLALIYYDQKRFSEAIGKFQELLRTHPEDDRIIYYLGVIYENLKRDSEAEGEFSKIEEDSNFFKDARLHMAYLKVRADRKEEAIQILEDAIDRKPEEGPLYEYLSEIVRDEGDFSQAIEILKTGLKKSKDKEVLNYTLGILYDQAGRFEESMRAMRQVLKVNPKNAQAMNYIGYSYADRKMNLDEALQLLQKAIALKPDDGYITDSLGWVYFQRGEIDQAMLHIQKAYRMTPGEATITEHLGDIFLKKDDKTTALRYFREAVALLEKKKKAKKNEEQIIKDLERLRKKIKEAGA